MKRRLRTATATVGLGLVALLAMSAGDGSSVSVVIDSLVPDSACINCSIELSAAAAFTADGDALEELQAGWTPEYRWKWELLADGVVSSTVPALAAEGWTQWSTDTTSSATGSFPSHGAKQAKITVQVRLVKYDGAIQDVCEGSVTETLNVVNLQDAQNFRVVSYDDGCVTVAWDPSPSPNVAGYMYHIEPDNEQLIDVGDVTEYTITGLTNGQTYTVGLHTYNTSGDMTHTVMLTFTALGAPPPEVTGLHVVAYGPGEAVIAWDPATHPDIVGYKYGFPGGAVATISDKSVTQLKISGLTPGATVTVVVKTYKADGNTSAGVSLPLTPPATSLDGDNDGLWDWWEDLHGLDKTVDTGADGPLGDPDGDGMANLLEYLQGTDPNVSDVSPIVGMRVEVENAEDNPDPQCESVVFSMPSTSHPFVLEVTVAAEVETMDSGYDIVTVNGTQFLEGHADGVDGMVLDCNIIKLPLPGGSDLTLTYDTVDGNYHTDGYAEIDHVELVGLIVLDVDMAGTTAATEEAPGALMPIHSVSGMDFSFACLPEVGTVSISSCPGYANLQQSAGVPLPGSSWQLDDPAQVTELQSLVLGSRLIESVGTGEGEYVTLSYSGGGVAVDDKVKVASIRVSSVASDREAAGLGDTVTFSATTDPAGYESTILHLWHGTGTPATQSGGETFSTHWTSIGNKTVQALYGLPTQHPSDTVEIVKIDTLTVDPAIVCVGSEGVTTLTAATQIPGYESLITWAGYGSSWHETRENGTELATYWDTSGTKSVEAKCGVADTPQSETIEVVQAEDSYLSSVTAPSAGGTWEIGMADHDGDGMDERTYVLPRSTSGLPDLFYVHADWSPAVASADLPPQWTFSSAPADTPLPGYSFCLDERDVGTTVVTSTCGTSKKQTTMHIVEMGRLTCEGKVSSASPAPVGQTVYVPVGFGGGTVTVTAYPSEDGKPWPNSFPEWTGDTTAADGDVSAQVSTATAGVREVWAECGKTIHMKVVVVELGTLTLTDSWDSSNTTSSTWGGSAPTSKLHLLERPNLVIQAGVDVGLTWSPAAAVPATMLKWEFSPSDGWSPSSPGDFSTNPTTASWSHTGPPDTREFAVSAWADLNQDGSRDANEPQVSLDLSVILMDVVYDGLPEESPGGVHEMDPGGLLALNNNDNDGISGVVDQTTLTMLPQVDADLRPVDVAMEPVPTVGTVTLGHSGIRVWEGGNKASLQGTWNLGMPGERTAFVEFLTKQKQLYVEGIIVGTGDHLEFQYDSRIGDRVAMTVPPEVTLDIFNEHGGPQLAEAEKVNPGSFVLVNIDDDDGANGSDNSNTVIDGGGDRLDMAKMRLNVQPSTATGLTVELKASDATVVRVFDESGSPVSFPDTIAMARFATGAIDYYVEGLNAGVCDFTLEVRSGTTLMCSPAPKVRISVNEYYGGFNAWGAWPGGHTTGALNPTETISSSDLGLSGEVQWAVDHGGSTASPISATIVSTVPPTGTKFSQVVVRYGTVSPTSSFTEAVEIKAYDTGADGKLAAVRRTVFMPTWRPPNTTGPLDVTGGNNLRFPLHTGTNTAKAEFNWDGERGSMVVSAKVECVVDFGPTGINWSARGVTWQHSDTGVGAKWCARLHRLKLATGVEQLKTGQGSASRRITAGPYNDAFWVYDGDSDVLDAQNPTAAKPDSAFRLDAPGVDAGVFKQFADRADFREIVEWHNKTGWSTVTAAANAEWHYNGTAVLPNGAKGGSNGHGPGATADDIPNTRPVAMAGNDQTVASGAVVVLDGSASSDADHDTLTHKWTQSAGPTVMLSNDTAEKPTFTAPGGAATLVFELKVSDICKGLNQHRPANYESAPDSVAITVNAP